jgi:hypothetical protein
MTSHFSSLELKERKKSMVKSGEVKKKHSSRFTCQFKGGSDVKKTDFCLSNSFGKIIL